LVASVISNRSPKNMKEDPTSRIQGQYDRVHLQTALRDKYS
jgi:hypothetical protein